MSFERVQALTGSSKFVQVESVNLEAMRQALGEAPTLCFQFVRAEMLRGCNRFRRRLIAERMSGRPGIDWGGAKKVGGNVKVLSTGASLTDFKLIVKGSKLLAVHEYGATIMPTQGEFLFLKSRGLSAKQVATAQGHNLTIYHARGPGGFGEGQAFGIMGKVRSVTIPARLGFKNLFNTMTPEILAKAQDALTRGLRVSFERRVKAVSSTIQRLVA